MLKPDETSYRINCIQSAGELFAEKKVALYGIGDNAKYILERVDSFHPLALIDEHNYGKMIHGKPVLALNEALLLGIEVIIIAAEAGSSIIVCQRIASFCCANHIALFNMYGINELERQKCLLEQRIEYAGSGLSILKGMLERNSVIFFQLEGVLCVDPRKDSDSLFTRLEELSGDEGLATLRKDAERSLIKKRRPYTLRDVYIVYQRMTYETDQKINKLYHMEWELFLERLKPHTEVIKLLNETSKKKEIVILSNMPFSIKEESEVLDRIDIKRKARLLHPSVLKHTFSDGALRAAMDLYKGEKVFYLGTEEDERSMLAFAYGMDYAVIPDVNEDIEKAALNRQSTFQIDHLMDTTSGLDMKSMDIPRYDYPRVSIIIPAHDHFDYTIRCVASVLKNSKNIAYEVIIGDDASSDDTGRIEEVISGIKVVRSKENLQFVKICNRAAQEAKGEYLYFLNNDTQVLSGFMASMVSLLDRSESIGIVGSKLIYPDGTLQEAGGIVRNNGGGWQYGRGQNPDLPQFNYVRETDYVSGASMMIRKSLWDRLGGFDELFSPAYGEDADLAFRVRALGYKVVYQPESKVIHFEGISNGKSLSKGAKRYQLVNKAKFCKRWKDTLDKEHIYSVRGINAARERKLDRKTILICSEKTPEYDRDAGSRTLDMYIHLFLKKGFIVKLATRLFVDNEQYDFHYRQLGVEVFSGEYWKENFDEWVIKNHKDIDYALINYPDCGERFLELMLCKKIRTYYYGMDLHYLRNKREYELTGNVEKLRYSERYEFIERHLIEKADIAYYPSQEEVEVVQREFNPQKAKCLMPYFFMTKTEKQTVYIPRQRDGLFFIGGYAHPPNVDAVLWFVKDIYPQIYERLKATLYIAGSQMPTEIIDLQSPGVQILGALSSEELEEWYEKIRLVVIPLRFGAGVKGKVVESMYREIPLISTSIGIEGIPEADRYTQPRDEAEEFAKKVIEIYNDENQLTQMSRGFHQLIERHYSEDAAWNNIKDDFQ